MEGSKQVVPFQFERFKLKELLEEKRGPATLNEFRNLIEQVRSQTFVVGSRQAKVNMEMETNFVSRKL